MYKNKKREKMRIKAVCELMGLCLKINGLGVRKKEVTGDKTTVFIRYSGHVDEISIDIHSTGWYPDDYPDKEYSIYLNRDNFWEKYSDTKRRLLEMVE